MANHAPAASARRRRTEPYLRQPGTRDRLGELNHRRQHAHRPARTVVFVVETIRPPARSAGNASAGHPRPGRPGQQRRPDPDHRPGAGGRQPGDRYRHQCDLCGGAGQRTRPARAAPSGRLRHRRLRGPAADRGGPCQRLGTGHLGRRRGGDLHPATGTDEQGGAATVACLPASGSTFPVGNTTVTCTATDAVGHTATSTFSVIVGAFAPDPGALAARRGDGPARTGELLDRARLRRPAHRVARRLGCGEPGGRSPPVTHRVLPTEGLPSRAPWAVHCPGPQPEAPIGPLALEEVSCVVGSRWWQALPCSPSSSFRPAWCLRGLHTRWPRVPGHAPAGQLLRGL